MRLPLSAQLAMALVLGAGSFAAAAQTVDARADANAQAATTAAASDGETVARPDAEGDIDRRCLRSTGSHIVAARNATADNAAAGNAVADAKPDCVIGNGRVYTRKDLEGTGHTNVVDALRTLDPAIH